MHHATVLQMKYTDLAQTTIQNFISQCSRSGPAPGEAASDVAIGLSCALQDLVRGLEVDRGLMWISVPETGQLTVIQECIQDGSVSMIGASLDSVEGGRLIIGLMNLPESITAPSKQTKTVQIHESESSVPGWEERNPFSKFCGNYKSTMLVGLQARGSFPGFLSFQTKRKRTWTPGEESTLRQVAVCLGLFLSYELEIARLIDLSERSRERL
jgi:hypothetical protein